MKIIKLITLLTILTLSWNINSGNAFNIYSYTICTEDVTQTNNAEKVSKERRLKNLSLTSKQIGNVLDNKEIITKISKKYNVPISTIAGIWYAEKGFLTGGTPFGIKCYTKTTSKVYHYDDCGDKKCCFERYDSFEEAVSFFCVFIQNQRDYRYHLDYKNNYTDFEAIANSGYCTAKKTWIKNTKRGVIYYNKIINTTHEKEQIEVTAKDS